MRVPRKAGKTAPVILSASVLLPDVAKCLRLSSHPHGKSGQDRESPFHRSHFLLPSPREPHGEAAPSDA